MGQGEDSISRWHISAGQSEDSERSRGNSLIFLSDAAALFIAMSISSQANTSALLQSRLCPSGDPGARAQDEP
jgi:hypothetical protein